MRKHNILKLVQILMHFVYGNTLIYFEFHSSIHVFTRFLIYTMAYSVSLYSMAVRHFKPIFFVLYFLLRLKKLWQSSWSLFFSWLSLKPLIKFTRSQSRFFSFSSFVIHWIGQRHSIEMNTHFLHTCYSLRSRSFASSACIKPFLQMKIQNNNVFMHIKTNLFHNSCGKYWIL